MASSSCGELVRMHGAAAVSAAVLTVFRRG